MSPEILVYLNVELPACTPHFNNFPKIYLSFSCQTARTLLGSPPNHQFQREERVGGMTDNTILSSTECKKVWTCNTSTAQVVKAWCLIKEGTNLPFLPLPFIYCFFTNSWMCSLTQLLIFHSHNSISGTV